VSDVVHDVAFELQAQGAQLRPSVIFAGGTITCRT
jgi:hypothetical protein